MITAVTTPAQAAEFARRIAGKPFFEPTMGTHLTLFGDKPETGRGFYLLPGDAALECRGGAASVCGSLPGGEDAEELNSFLRFLGIDRILCESDAPLGWQPGTTFYCFGLPAFSTLPAVPVPEKLAQLTWTRSPQTRMDKAAALLFPQGEERDAFYSTCCTAIAHGVGSCWALESDGKVISTVGCYESSDTQAYMAAGKTLHGWRGQHLGGWLIAGMANELAAQGKSVIFLCKQCRCHFYTELGFVQIGEYRQYITK